MSSAQVITQSASEIMDRMVESRRFIRRASYHWLHAQAWMMRRNPRLHFDGELGHELDQFIRFGAGDAASHCVFGIVPFHPANLKVGGRRLKRRSVGGFQTGESVIVTAKLLWTIPFGADDHQ